MFFAARIVIQTPNMVLHIITTSCSCPHTYHSSSWAPRLSLHVLSLYLECHLSPTALLPLTSLTSFFNAQVNHNFSRETFPRPSQDELSAPPIAIASNNCWLPCLCPFSTVSSLKIETSSYSPLHSSILEPGTKQLLNKY